MSGVRKIDELEYIQSDVTVHPGSSGGALLDSRGNVVGVTDLGVRTRARLPQLLHPGTDLEKYVPVDFEYRPGYAILASEREVTTTVHS